MATKKRTYHKVILSNEVFLLWEAWHNLKGPFTGWKKTTNSNSVRFETTYQLVKKKRVTVEYIEEHKVAIIIPPRSEDPKIEFKILLYGDTHTAHKSKIKNLIKPIVRKFIIRNY